MVEPGNIVVEVGNVKEFDITQDLVSDLAKHKEEVVTQQEEVEASERS